MLIVIMSYGRLLNEREMAELRPDVFLGNMQSEQTTMYVWVDDHAELRDIKLNRGLYNIVREIISNAIDNVWRSEHTDTPVTKIEITVDIHTGIISVWNDGVGIPVELHDYQYTDLTTNQVITIRCYPSEIFFGRMFSGTNYNDDEERKTSGKNGIGATLCNIMSDEFEVDQASAPHGKRLVQKYSVNNSQKTSPKVTSYSKPKSYTCITFKPSLSKFGETVWWPEMEQAFAFFAREVATITGSRGVTIKYNGQLIRIPTLDKFAKCLFPHHKFCHLKAPNGDECVVVNIDADPDLITAEQVRQHSYVNGCQTYQGGIHVDKWCDALVGRLVRRMNSRKSTKAKPIVQTTAKHIYPYLHMIVLCTVDRPKFKDGNTKSALESLIRGTKEKPVYAPYSLTCDSTTSKEDKEWGETLKEAVETIMKWPMIKQIDETLRAQDSIKKIKPATTTRSSMLNMNSEYYTDAPYAGKPKTKHLAILNLTEGLSASGLVKSGIQHLSEEERMRYGTLPLKGKIISAKKHPREKVLKNKEIQDIMELLGLQLDVDYTIDSHFEKLRYGQVRILTDADDDGIHIRGLLFTFFWCYARSLFFRPGYITSHSTPNVQVILKNPKEKLDFYAFKDYQYWASDPEHLARLAKEPIYIKGLGSIDQKDAPRYYEHAKIINYRIHDQTDDEAMELAFGETKTQASNRMKWLTQYEDNVYEMTLSEGEKTLSEFVNKDALFYFRMTFRRSLPCIWDGFKESTRKIFYGFRKENITELRTCDECEGMVKKSANYHHGMASLNSAIAGMGFDFVGTNNLNVIQTGGNNGTREMGGEDHAADRYMKARLHPWAQTMFRWEDEPILTPVVENGKEVEMTFYAPVIPMILVNGADGISTGCVSHIPACHPLTLIDYCLKWLDGDTDLPVITPWYKGFTGTVTMDDNGKGWSSTGILRPCKKAKYKDWWEIVELPIGTWPLPYFNGPFRKLMQPSEKESGSKRCAILEAANMSKPDTVEIRFRPAKDFIPSMDHPNNFKHLTQHESLHNLVAVDEHNVPHRYDSLNDMIATWCPMRLPLYAKRRNHDLQHIKERISMLKDKLTYVEAMIEGHLRLNEYEEKSTLYEALQNDFGLTMRASAGKTKPSFKYLLDMPTRAMTLNQVTLLKESIAKEIKSFKELKSKSDKDLWRSDLLELRALWCNEYPQYSW